jgi:TolB-like protein/Flp pilus assembly protein TadD
VMSIKPAKLTLFLAGADTLDDDPEHPRYIETLPRHGYRFIVPIESVTPVSSPAAVVGAIHELPLQRRWKIAAAGGALAATIAILLALNVGGLRDRLMTVVGAGSARLREGKALPYPKIESIAVLPLENLSQDPEQEYFAEGMTEELITSLGKISALRVISRTSVMRYKGTKKGLPEIAKELNVDAIVEGTILRSGNRVRITANLLHAPTDRHLWAESYEREVRDALALQSEVAQAIAHEVQVKLTPQEQARLTSTRPVNPQAYEAYVKGRHFSAMGLTLDSQLKAIEFFHEAIQIDPGYASAYSSLGNCYENLTLLEYPPIRENQQKARALVLKALALDDKLAEAHTNLAEQMCVVDWDWSGGLAEFRRALELDPGNSYVLYHYAWGLDVLGRFDEAIPLYERAVQLDPLSYSNLVLAVALWNAHQDERAIDQYQKTLDLELNNAATYYNLGSLFEAMGRYDEAVSAYLKGEPFGVDSTERVQALRDAYKAGGIRGFWRKRLEYLKRRAERARVSPLAFARAYTHAGDNEQALSWLEKACQQHTPGLFDLKVERTWEPLRSDPRFQALVRRMNFPP